MPLLVQQMSGTFNRDMGVIYLGISISVLPILAAFAFFSRWILGGLTVGAVKG
jgi:multiple sugar transport system permease protein